MRPFLIPKFFIQILKFLNAHLKPLGPITSIWSNTQWDSFKIGAYQVPKDSVDLGRRGRVLGTNQMSQDSEIGTDPCHPPSS